MPSRRSTRPFVEELPDLLKERGLSIRSVARSAEVDPAHLSRVLRGDRGKVISADLAGRVAVALGLPEDYFPEWREASIVERLRKDPEFRDQVYDQARRK